MGRDGTWKTRDFSRNESCLTERHYGGWAGPSEAWGGRGEGELPQAEVEGRTYPEVSGYRPSRHCPTLDPHRAGARGVRSFSGVKQPS